MDSVFTQGKRHVVSAITGIESHALQEVQADAARFARLSDLIDHLRDRR